MMGFLLRRYRQGFQLHTRVLGVPTLIVVDRPGGVRYQGYDLDEAKKALADLPRRPGAHFRRHLERKEMHVLPGNPR